MATNWTLDKTLGKRANGDVVASLDKYFCVYSCGFLGCGCCVGGVRVRDGLLIPDIEDTAGQNQPAS
jgi:hypothetical protein